MGKEKLDHYLEFIKRAKFNKIGRNVKAADIKDNLDISRIDDITERDIDRLNPVSYTHLTLPTICSV